MKEDEGRGNSVQDIISLDTPISLRPTALRITLERSTIISMLAAMKAVMALIRTAQNRDGDAADIKNFPER